MHRRAIICSAALAVLQLSNKGFGGVPVEQIEAYDTPVASWNTQPYAPVNFNGGVTVTINGGGYGGQYDGITFHADIASGIGGTVSGHAQTVGDFFYGSTQSSAYPFVTDVYNISADQFMSRSVQSQNSTGVGPLPGTFFAGAKVINNSYIESAANTSAYQDVNRRLDYMIDQADVVWVAGAVTGGAAISGPQYEVWSNFNGLAVSGVQNSQQSFNPAGSPGKQHADLSVPSLEASFATALVSGDATALWGNAQAANQLNAQHGYVIRSLLMAGASHSNYNRPAGNSSGALDPINGAGQPDFTKSLSIMQGGESEIMSLGTGGSVATNQQGWAIGSVTTGGQSVLLFQTGGMSGLTVALNWNVTSQTDGINIDTSANALKFPNLALNICAVNYNTSDGSYTLGNIMSDATLRGEVAGDNVQYLSSNTHLTAGTYAFLITGDLAFPATVGLSYSLAESSTTQWTGSTDGKWTNVNRWTNGVPNAQAAQANLVGLTAPAGSAISPPSTLSLNGNRTIGQLTFNNLNGYLIAPGSGGTLTIDDTNDSAGTINPLITVVNGNHSITAAVVLTNGVNVSVASGTSLNISGGITGIGGLTKSGPGLLTLAGMNSYGATIVSDGNLTVDSNASLSSGAITVNAGGTLKFAASSGGILIRRYPITINGNVTLNPATSASTRQLLISDGLNIAGSTGHWTGQLDLTNNDLDVPAGSLADITSQIQQGIDLTSGLSSNLSGGVVSSTAAADSTHLTTLGVIRNNQSGNARFNSVDLFDGISPGASDILVTHAFYGDANLDGKVDGTDYGLLNLAYQADQSNPVSDTGWYNGDFNYDGIINGSDYTLIDNVFLSGVASESSAAASTTTQIFLTTTTVPEPSAMAFLAMGCLIFTTRCKTYCL